MLAQARQADAKADRPPSHPHGGALADFDPLEVEILYADASDAERIVMEAAADAIGRQPRKRGDQVVWEPPRATPPAVVSKIVYLRQTYHFGPGKIADYLKRFHDIAALGRPSTGFWFVTECRGYPRIRSIGRSASGGSGMGNRSRGTVSSSTSSSSSGFQGRASGCTVHRHRRLHADSRLKVFDACNQRTAIRFIDEVRHRLRFRLHVVQTDNGAEFRSQFHWHLEGLDIRHVYIKPRSPHLNGILRNRRTVYGVSRDDLARVWATSRVDSARAVATAPSSAAGRLRTSCLTRRSRSRLSRRHGR